MHRAGMAIQRLGLPDLQVTPAVLAHPAAVVTAPVAVEVVLTAAVHVRAAAEEAVGIQAAADIVVNDTFPSIFFRFLPPSLKL